MCFEFKLENITHITLGCTSGKRTREIKGNQSFSKIEYIYKGHLQKNTKLTIFIYFVSFVSFGLRLAAVNEIGPPRGFGAE